MSEIKYYIKAFLDENNQPKMFRLYCIFNFYYGSKYIFDFNGNKYGLDNYSAFSRGSSLENGEKFTIDFSPEYIKNHKDGHIFFEVYGNRGNFKFHITKIYISAIYDYFYGLRKAAD